LCSFSEGDGAVGGAAAALVVGIFVKNENNLDCVLAAVDGEGEEDEAAAPVAGEGDPGEEAERRITNV
jgi:hypothetical protein